MAFLKSLPPVNNMGVENTLSSFKKKPDKRILVDWFQCTVKNINPIHMCHLIGFDFSEFKEEDVKRMKGFKHSYSFLDIYLFYNPEKSYCHLQLSGSGCRTFEENSRLENFENLFANLEGCDFKISRIDFAIDVFDNDVTPQLLVDKISEGNVVSRFREFDPQNKLKIGKNQVCETLYMGSPRSETRFCFYNKKLEQWEVYNKQVDYDYWYRFEIRFRDDVATKFVKEYFYKIMAHSLYGIILSKLDFKEDTGDKNLSRRKTVKWWSDFLGSVLPLKLSKEMSYSLEKTYMWLENSVSSALAVLDEVGVDVDHFVKVGKTKLNKKHEKMLEIHNNKQKKSSSANEDFLKKILPIVEFV